MLRGIINLFKIFFIPCRNNKYRPRFLGGRFLLYYLIVILVLKAAIVPIAVYFPKSIFFADITENSLVELVNQEREKNGLDVLKENQALREAAYLKAKDMLEKGYFAHYSPEGMTPWFWFGKAGYSYQFAGENLAIGFFDPEEVHKAWVNSSSHKENLLNKNYEDVGIAVMKGQFGQGETTVVVQLFGNPKKEPVMLAKNQEPFNVSEKKTKEVKEVAVVKEEPAAETFLTEELLAKVSSSQEVVNLSASEEPLNPAYIEKEISDAITFKFFNFLALKYSKLIQGVIYGSLMFIIISLLINILIKFNIQYPRLILKTFGFILILFFFVLIDKEEIIKMIPHNFGIY